MLSKSQKAETMNVLKIQIGSDKPDEGAMTDAFYVSRFVLLSKPVSSRRLESALVFAYHTVCKQLYQPVQSLVFFPLEIGGAQRCPEVYRGIHLIPFEMFGMIFEDVKAVLVNDYFCSDCLDLVFDNLSFDNLSKVAPSLSDGEWLRMAQLEKGLLLFGITDKCVHPDEVFNPEKEIKRLEAEIRRLEGLL